jgi:hypothetical protein
MYAPILSGVATFLSFSIATQAFTSPCIVGEQKCGFYLVTADGIILLVIIAHPYHI